MYTIYTPLILLKYHELFLLLRTYLQHTCHVFTPVAVVRSRPNSHNIFLLEQLVVALLNQLMSTSYQSQPIMMIELIDHFRAEKPANSSMILLPSLDVFRIRPHQVSKGAFSRNLLHSVDLSDLINCMNVRRKSSMNAENVV